MVLWFFPDPQLSWEKWLCVSRFQPTCLKLVFVITSLKERDSLHCTWQFLWRTIWRWDRKGNKDIWYYCLNQWSNSHAISLLYYNRLLRWSEILVSGEKTFCTEDVNTTSCVLPCTVCACTHTRTLARPFWSLLTLAAIRCVLLWYWGDSYHSRGNQLEESATHI